MQEIDFLTSLISDVQKNEMLKGLSFQGCTVMKGQVKPQIVDGQDRKNFLMIIESLPFFPINAYFNYTEKEQRK